MQKMLIATRNVHKTAEFQEILEGLFELSDLTAHPEIPPIVETGATFHENAALKAMAGSKHFGGIVLADDSGIEVDALAGAPGVFSARYAGKDATDEQNRVKLLEELDRVSAKGKARSGRFRCVLAIARNGRMIEMFEGVVNGMIINQAKGEGGFGYDPVFVPEGYCKTFAQLDATIKNKESHRARAIAKLMEFFQEQQFF